MLSLTFALSLAVGAVSALSDASLKTYANSLALTNDFNPVKGAYWTNLPKHRRTPFALSPDGKSAYLAYLDSSETDVHVQQVDPTTFANVGTTVTVTGTKEAGGLVAHNDGFALLTNEPLPSGTTNAPPGNTPVPVLYRYTNGKQTFRTLLGGPTVHADDGLSMSPDLNGDLVYSEAAGLYGAYFVVTDYQGWAEGHFGDSIQYVDNTGTLKPDTKGTSSWGCSHNTGIAIEAADAAPFATICAEDHGNTWLNTGGLGMGGTKISNEHVINGASNEPMGGMSGSYSSLARFQGSGAYMFAWVSRGSSKLDPDTWMGDGFVTSENRTDYRRVAIAQLSDKSTLVGPAAISTVGATNGDAQINWVSDGPNDASNARVATFDGTNALVSWDSISSPSCTDDAMDCKGTYDGAYFQLVTDGKKSGAPVHSTSVFVSGDQVTMPDGRICWPYVDMTWQSAKPVGQYSGTADVTTKQISFACMTNGDAGSAPAPAPSSSSAAPASSSSSAAPAPAPSSSTAAPVPTATPSSTAAPVPTTSAAPAPVPTTSAAPAPVPTTSEAPVPVSSAGEYSSSAAPVNVPTSSVPGPIAPTGTVPVAPPSAPPAGPTAAPTGTAPADGPACPVTWVTVYV